MATIEEVIQFSQDQVIDALNQSDQFVNELAEAISWRAEWQNINFNGVPRNDYIAVNRVGLPLRPNAPNFVWNEEKYVPSLLEDAKQIILSDLRNGGYGINPADEQALWQRAKDRESQNADNAINDYMRSMAARGFSIPSGAMMAGVQKVQQQSRGAISTVNRDISIKRADMYVQARQFAITNGLNAEQFMVNYYSSFAERTLNSIRILVEKTGIDLRVWESSRADAIKDAQFELDKWAKNTEAFLSIAKLQLDEKRAITENEHNISVEGITAATNALNMYKSIIESSNNASSAITTLAS
jgi:hypothetical protein